jgi:hypothetical protein
MHAHRTLFFVIAVLAGCDRVDGSGRPAVSMRPLAPFNAAEVSAGIEVTWTAGAQEVRVEGDDNIVPHVRTEVAGGRLHVWPDHDLHPSLPLRVQLRTTALSEATLAAGGRFLVSGVDAPSLTVRVQAGGELFADGTVDQLTAELSSGGTLDASRVLARAVHLTASAGAS